MRDIDYLFEGDVSAASPSAKICSVCGKRLSKYNTLGYCFHHPDPEQERKRLEREDRFAALAEKKSVQSTMPDIPESTNTQAETTEEAFSEEKVIELTCRLFGISREQIISQGRQPIRVRARHVLMYLLYTDTRLSYPAIGDLLDGRDHTTIIHGVSKITGELETDPELQNLIRYLRSQYQSPLTEM